MAVLPDSSSHNKKGKASLTFPLENHLFSQAIMFGTGFD